MFNLLVTIPTLPLAHWIDSFVDWLTQFAGFFVYAALGTAPAALRGCAGGGRGKFQPDVDLGSDRKLVGNRHRHSTGYLGCSESKTVAAMSSR